MNAYKRHCGYTDIRVAVCLRVMLCLICILADVGNALADVVTSKSNEYYLSGYVRDAETNEPLAFASVTVAGSAAGTLTDEKGKFELTVPASSQQLQITCLGYERGSIDISKNTPNKYEVYLTPASYQLNDVVVKKQKYSKKNNPAVDFARRLRTLGPTTDPRRNDYYSYDRYQLLTLAFNDFGPKEKNRFLSKKFPVMWEHVDTSEVTGKPILNVMLKEKVSTMHYRKDPQTVKEVVSGIRQDGIDEILDKQSVQVYIDDVLREIDLYDNDINILHNRFVSPLSSIAPDFYKFYLTDTVVVDNEQCIVLSFYPHNRSTFGFTGQVFVPVSDSTMFIKRVVMRTPRDINLNFINNMFVVQEFVKAPDGSRLKVKDDATIEMSILPGTSGFYIRRDIGYTNHSFDRPQDLTIFDRLESQIEADSAATRNEQYWDNVRLVGISDNEKQVGNMFESLRRTPFYYWNEKIIELMIMGYVHTGKNSKFDYGPLNTSISSNTVEGVRLRAGGMTTANLSKHWFASGYIAYGTVDRRWKYDAELEYSFNEKEYHPGEFPIHSIKLSSLYDTDQLGQHYLFTNKDNFFLSLKRLPDTQVTYHRVNAITYRLELNNHLSFNVALKNIMQEATSYIPFVDGYGNSIPRYYENMAEIELRYAPNEKFYQTQNYRSPINPDNPVFILTHTFGPKGFGKSRYAINKTEISIQKRVWFSAWGYTDIIVKGGHVWSRSPFIDLLIPNANLSYTYQPESYALMNAMEFVNDTYASTDLTYWANGALLNYIPYVKKLKLREAFGLKCYWGHLSMRNDPQYHPELLAFPSTANVTRMTNTPYIEASVGIDNILKCLRLDYVWRLTYLDVPYVIDRHGLRVSVHVTF